MRQWAKIREVLHQYNLEIKCDCDDNVQMIVTDKIDKSVGVFESKGFGLTISKVHTHMKKHNRKIKRNLWNQ